MNSVAVAGASGLVGSSLLPLLLQQCDRVAAVTRRPFAVSSPKLVEIRADFDRLPPLGPIDAAFCTLGTTIKKAGSQEAFRRVDHGYVVAFAQAAYDAGAKRFAVVSSVGAEPGTSNFYLRVKSEMEDAVKAIPFEGVYIMRPSFLMGDRPEARPGEKIGIAVSRALAFLLVGGLRRYRPISVDHVARAMFAAVRSAPAGRHVYEYNDLMRLAGS